MKVQYRIPAKVTGKKEENYCIDVSGLLQLIKAYRLARKKQCSAFFIFF